METGELRLLSIASVILDLQFIPDQGNRQWTEAPPRPVTLIHLHTVLYIMILSHKTMLVYLSHQQVPECLVQLQPLKVHLIK